MLILLVPAVEADFICTRNPAYCDGSFGGAVVNFRAAADLSGTLPTELANLNGQVLIPAIPFVSPAVTSGLNSVQVFGSRLSGTIPTEIGNLNNWLGMTALLLHDNLLSGTIPTELGRLTGGFTVPAIATAPGLVALQLENNRLSGVLPTELANCGQLAEMHFDNNRLSGTMPTQFSSFNLRLDIPGWFNTIFSSIGFVPRSGFRIFGNALSGTVPAEMAEASTTHGWPECLLTDSQCQAAVLPNCGGVEANSFQCPFPEAQSGSPCNANFDCFFPPQPPFPPPPSSPPLPPSSPPSLPPSPPPLPPPSLPPRPPPLPSAFGGQIYRDDGEFYMAPLVSVVVAIPVMLALLCWWRGRVQRKAHAERVVLMREAEQTRRAFELVAYEGKTNSQRAEELHDKFLETIVGLGGLSSLPNYAARFVGGVCDLVFGQPQDAALGITHFMRVPDSLVYNGMLQGVGAICAEFQASGTEVDKECLQYVLLHGAGTSDKQFPNGIRDRDPATGEPRADRLSATGQPMSLADFAAHPHSRAAELSEAHVLALRLYSTAAYSSLNSPLRQLGRAEPHPFPVTIKFITDGIKQLRAVEAERGVASNARPSSKATSQSGSRCSSQERGSSGPASRSSVCSGRLPPSAHNGPVDLWRGLRDRTVDAAFQELGGTEFAPMSTTTSLEVAIKYSAGASSSVLLRLRTSSFMQRGADLSYLSCFPNEQEILYPPLTFLQVQRVIRVPLPEMGVEYQVVEVVPHVGS